MMSALCDRQGGVRCRNQNQMFLRGVHPWPRSEEVTFMYPLAAFSCGNCYFGLLGIPP